MADKINTCNICGNEADIVNGGAALMMAFCHNHSTNLTNVQFCKDCYEHLMKDAMKKLEMDCCLDLHLDDEEE